MIKPHGGNLINRVVTEGRKAELEEKANTLYNLKVHDRFVSDCEMIANGGFSPLTGFMDRTTVESVLEKMELPDGLVWALPVILPVQLTESKKISVGDMITISDKNGKLIAVMHVSEKFEVEIDEYCQKIYKTSDIEHPGVKVIKESGSMFLGGNIELINMPDREDIADEYFLDPKQTREKFKQLGWKTIVAFQTRNPIHRAHEYLIKCALEARDGLLIHPIVGETKPDDIPADVRMECYDVLMKNYFNSEKTMVSVLPAAMRYAGPREAVHHMIVRKNYGCTHMIIGRDHAGVGNYYGTYEAQEMVDEVAEKLEIIPIKFEHTFYCNKCESMASAKTCPHSSEDHVFLSGTKVRTMLGEGQSPPKEFSRPEVAEVLIKWATKTKLVTSD